MLANFIEALTQWAEHLVTTIGAPGIAVIALMENLFPPTPSEWLYPLAGKMAYDGNAQIPLIIIAGVIGAIIGSTIWYYLGYRLGEDRVRLLIAKYGRISLFRWGMTVFTVADYDRTVTWFDRYGGPIVMFARMLPLVHGIVSLPAGVMRMPLVKFYIYTIAGSALWISFLTIFGFWLGSQWEQLLNIVKVYENVWYVVIAVVIIVFVVRRVRKQRQVTTEVAEPANTGD